MPFTGAVEANGRTEQALVLAQVGGRRMPEAHLGRREVEAGRLPRDHEPGGDDELRRVSRQLGRVAQAARG